MAECEISQCVAEGSRPPYHTDAFREKIMLKKLQFAVVLAVLTIPMLLIGMHDTHSQPAKEHRLVLQVDTEDADTMNLALNNAMNAKRYYDEHGEKVIIEIVAYGPGITMLRSDTSPVKDRIEQTKASIPGIALSMCGNAKAGAEKREGHEIIPLPGVKVVPAGIVRIMELEEQGYSYVRP
jgi:intracellular sulfur oxidation DsrE/DsrF family protein